MRLSFLEYCVTKTLVMGLPSITPSGQVLARCQRSRILDCISLEKKVYITWDVWNLSEELMKVWIGIFHFYSRDEVAKFYLYVGGAYTYPFEMIMSITSLPKAIFSRIRVPMCAYALIHMRYASTTCQGLHTRPHNLSFSTASVSHLSRSLTLLPPPSLSLHLIPSFEFQYRLF